MADFEMATPPSVVQGNVFTIPAEELDRLRTAKEMRLDDGVLFQAQTNGRWHLPPRGTYHGILTAVDAAGGIADLGGGIEEATPNFAVFQELASVEIPNDGFVRRMLQRAMRNRPESVTATLRRPRLTRAPVNSTFGAARETPVALSMPPITQATAVDRSVGRALLDPESFLPRYLTVAVGALFNRTVEFDDHSPTRNGKATTYTGREHWSDGDGTSTNLTGNVYDATLVVERPGFWRGVQSVARGRRPRSKATLTRGERW